MKTQNVLVWSYMHCRSLALSASVRYIPDGSPVFQSLACFHSFYRCHIYKMIMSNVLSLSIKVDVACEKRNSERAIIIIRQRIKIFVPFAL